MKESHNCQNKAQSTEGELHAYRQPSPVMNTTLTNGFSTVLQVNKRFVVVYLA